MSLPWWSGPKPTAAATPAPPDEPPGVASGCHGLMRAAVQRIHRRGAHRDFRGVGAADDDRAGATQMPHERRIGRRDHGREGRQAVRRRLAFLIDVHLDGHGHAEERPGRDAARERAIGRRRLRQRLLAAIHDDRVQRRIERADALDDRRHHLDARESLVANARRELDGARFP